MTRQFYCNVCFKFSKASSVQEQKESTFMISSCLDFKILNF